MIQDSLGIRQLLAKELLLKTLEIYGSITELIGIMQVKLEEI